MKYASKLILLMAMAMFAGDGFAADEGHLKLTTTVQQEAVVTTASGEEKTELVPASRVLPGESVIYTITYENVSEEAAENVTITNPVPENLTYEHGSAFGPGTKVEFSIDGGREFADATALKITENGEVRIARPEDYTHIRWVMDAELAAGAQGMARFRARLN